MRGRAVGFLAAWLAACAGGTDDDDTSIDDTSDTPCTEQTWYADADGDGFGDALATQSACSAPDGYVDGADDCDDADADAHAGAAEICGDGIDQDCDGEDPLCSASSDGWSVTARPVASGSTAGTVTGSFTLTRTSGAETRTGGGCLLADLVERGVGAATCTVDADCAVDSSYAALGWYGYCAAPEGSGEARRCWTRPGGPTTHCLRSIDVSGGAFAPGTYALPDATADAFGDGQPVRWALLACLANEATPAGCGSGDPQQYVRLVGPASSLSP